MEGRINWIDWAKAICIALVVMGHFNFNQSSFTYHSFIYAFHMPIFFLLSGYLHKTTPSFFDSLKKNIVSLIIPYIFFNILTFLIFTLPLLLLGKITTLGLETSFQQFLIGGSFTFAGPTWFLICLFNIKLISCFILKLKIYLQIIISTVFPILALVIEADLYFGLKPAFISIPFFVIGFHLKQQKLIEKIKDQFSLEFTLFLTSFFLLVIGNNIQGRVDIYKGILGEYPWLFYINALIGCFMVIMLCRMLNGIKSKFIRTISSATIVILGLHIFINGYVYKFVAKFGILIYSEFQINLPVLILMTIAVILILYYPIIFLQKYLPFFIGNRK